MVSRRLARRGCGSGPHEIRQELMETLSRLGWFGLVEVLVMEILRDNMRRKMSW